MKRKWTLARIQQNIPLFERLTSSSLMGEERGVQTGNIVYKINRAHGLQIKRQRQGGTCRCLGSKPVPWINE